ncbi:hypothetical protein A9Q94_07915 [Rhodobacterales bacterium 56_14_T64]|nr:hypothetical protein A9Q94_07915 [Rhodobacterales bacterium 56_14_T64]
MLVVLLLVLLTGCISSTRHFRGVEAVRLQVDGSVFDIRLRGNLAEAIRVNPQYAPRMGPLRARAGFAMAKVSGCKVTGVLGDQALMTGILDCQEAAPGAVTSWYDCGDVADWLKESGSAAYPKYECSPLS